MNENLTLLEGVMSKKLIAKLIITSRTPNHNHRTLESWYSLQQTI